MFTLSNSSKSTRFYNWLWKTDAKKFKTMCPYFWRYTLSIISLPLILIFRPVLSENRIGKSHQSVLSEKTNYRLEILFNIVALILCLVAIIAVVVVFCVALYKGFLLDMLIEVGLAIIALFVIFCVCNFLTSSGKIARKIKQPFIFLGNMIYSLYKKKCPLIKWV